MVHQNSNVIAIIPARGGSKGLPKKNILPICGIPLLAHSIRQCQKSAYIDATYVSTDDPEISSVALDFKAMVIHRPPGYPTDTSSSESVLVHAITHLHQNSLHCDLIIFLQCTSPLRSSYDLDRTIEQFYHEQADSLLSISPSHAFLWKNSADGPISTNYDFKHRPRRQDRDSEFIENGSFYIFKPKLLMETNKRLGGKISMYVMTQRTIDIDNLSDFQLAETLFKISLKDQYANH
jgi:N-acylneuraminate cytidylyltransferase